MALVMLLSRVLLAALTLGFPRPEKVSAVHLPVPGDCPGLSRVALMLLH